MRLAIIAPALALRAGLHTLSGFLPGSSDSVVLESASLDEYKGSGVEADVLLAAGEAVSEAGLRRLTLGEEARLGILVLSDRPETVRTLMELPLFGWGVLPADASAEELQAGLRAVAAGLAAVTPGMFAAAVKKPLPLSISGDALDAEKDGKFEALTERESQVLQHLARGLANKQIALTLGISEHTAKFHVSAIYAKLGAANRTEAVRAGVRRGLVVL